MTEAEIINSHKQIHNELSESYYKRHELPKEDFDFQHGKIWNDMEAQLIAEGYRQPPEPVMDYKAEILKLQDEVETLKGKS